MLGEKKKQKLIYCILFFGVLIVVLPILFVIVSSFKTENEIYSSPFTLPESPDFSPYVKLFTRYKMHINFRNSLLYTVVACIGILAIVVPAAYAIVRMKWRLSRVSLAFLMGGLMISTQAILIPLYIVTAKLGIPRPVMLVIIYIGTHISGSLLFMTGFLQGIPRELEESAVLDGASLWQAFWYIICPMLKPAIATITIMNFNAIWNDHMLALIYINEEKWKTVQLTVASFSSTVSNNYPMMLSSIVVAFIPSLIIAITLGDNIANGMAVGSVKG